jgi:hypothetical protein
MLYSYFNMRKHYFSSVYLLERANLIEKFYSATGMIKFIDIGCGPATTGIAITDHIFQLYGAPVSFDYFGIDYYNSMRQAAKSYMTNRVFAPGKQTCYLDNLLKIPFDSLDNSSCIIINTCYLFASDSLDEKELAKTVVSLRRSQPETPFFIFFQNTTDCTKNVKYANFKKLISSHTVILTDKVKIKYSNQRNSFYPPSGETVYLEILELH